MIAEEPETDARIFWPAIYLYQQGIGTINDLTLQTIPQLPDHLLCEADFYDFLFRV